MQLSAQYFNSHANPARVMSKTVMGSDKDCNAMGIIHQANPAPAITKKDQAAYSLAMQKAADNRRKVKVTLAALPF